MRAGRLVHVFGVTVTCWATVSNVIVACVFCMRLLAAGLMPAKQLPRLHK